MSITPKELHDDYKPVYALKDEMTGFGPPMVYANAQAALRDFVSTARDENSTIAKFRDDYALYRIGQYSYDEGYFEPEIEPILVLRAKNVAIPGKDVNVGEDEK